MDAGTCFLIECRTGCSCCDYENHYRGPFQTREECEAAIDQFRTIPLLASQYAKTGNYSISPVTCEQLPDGRLIIGGDRVVPGFATDPLCDDARLDW